jgi:hypothetical protein
MTADAKVLKTLKGFLHYGPAAQDNPFTHERRHVIRLRGAVSLGDKQRPRYEFIVDIQGKKRWACSVDDAPLTSDGADKRHHRFLGIKAASIEELNLLNLPENRDSLFDGALQSALKRLDYDGGCGTVVF